MIIIPLRVKPTVGQRTARQEQKFYEAHASPVVVHVWHVMLVIAIVAQVCSACEKRCWQVRASYLML